MKHRVILNSINVMLFFIALLLPFNLLESILGVLVLPLPFILSIFFKYEGIGGGDIKLIIALSFFLGLKKGVVAIILALFIFIAKAILIDKNKNQSMPLGPYLAIGSIITLFL
jgi:leader peptidase (prepilin peptidase)/N-methyltransferase